MLSPNPYFEEFDLLNGCFDGVNCLELNGFKWEQIKQILESNPQVKVETSSDHDQLSESTRSSASSWIVSLIGCISNLFQ